MTAKGCLGPAGVGASGCSLEQEGVCEGWGSPCLLVVDTEFLCGYANNLLFRPFGKDFFTFESPNSLPHVGFRRLERDAGMNQGATAARTDVQVPWLVPHAVVRRLCGFGSGRIPGPR